MKRSGFGSKGFSKSSVETTGKKIYALSFGSPASAFRALIPYSPYNLIYTTLDPSSILVSGGLVHKWNDTNQYAYLTQSSDSAKPAVDTTNILGRGYVGIRGQTDDSLTTDTKSASDTNTAITTILYARANHASTNASSIYYAPFSSWDTPLGSYYQVGNMWWSFCGPSYSNTTLFTEYFSIGTQVKGINLPSYSFNTGDPVDMFYKGNILVKEDLLDAANRAITSSLKTQTGTTYKTVSASSGSLSLPSGTWDSGFVGGKIQPKYWNIFRSSNGGGGYYTTDTTIYSFIKINGSLTSGELSNITAYLRSAYGAKQ
jgi:hypothetical protein